MRALDKVIGYSPIKKELFKIIDVLNNPDKYTKLGVSIPNGVMLEGEPGIGKHSWRRRLLRSVIVQHM